MKPVLLDETTPAIDGEKEILQKLLPSACRGHSPQCNGPILEEKNNANRRCADRGKRKVVAGSIRSCRNDEEHFAITNDESSDQLPVRTSQTSHQLTLFAGELHFLVGIHFFLRTDFRDSLTRAVPQLHSDHQLP